MDTIMRIVSVNVGLPRQVVSDGRSITTGIYKLPVHHRVRVGKLNIEGDGQGDLSVHGGLYKAVYAYPSEHYDYWRRELPGINLTHGMFGENLTLDGLMEDDVHIGDRFRMGEAILMVTQPRLPCYKLGIRFQRQEMPDQFLSSRRTGFYFTVVKEGELGEGDPIELIQHGVNRVSVSAILRLAYGQEPADAVQIEKALQVEALPPGWRKRLLKRMEEQTA